MKRLLLAAFSLSLFVPVSNAAEQTAIFAGGCFWCIEKDFEHVPGVLEVVSGYTGGSKKNPTYRSHEGHREAVKISYDDSKVSYDQLLHVFWRTVDPTDDGGQFCDRGYAYSTAVYALDGSQLDAAQASKKQAADELKQPIATEIAMASFWTDAEGYHQNYYKKNPVRYKYYRFRCGRDQRVKALWGDQAYTGVNYGS
jgi:peptide-methionine (S)-S-oxide reductase